MSVDVDLTGIETDARARLTELRTQRERLALDGLADPEIAEELRSVESEIASKETVLERIGLAKVEAQRRADAQAAEARANARREAYDGCVPLQAAVHKGVDEVNRLCGELTKAIRNCQDSVAELRSQARKAGISGIDLFSSVDFTGALAYAIREDGVRSLLQVDMTREQQRPLHVPSLPGPRSEQAEAPDRVRREPFPEIQIASGASGYYKNLRRWGATLETAVETTRSVYGEAASVRVLQAAEEELEAETTVAA